MGHGLQQLGFQVALVCKCSCDPCLVQDSACQLCLMSTSPLGVSNWTAAHTPFSPCVPLTLHINLNEAVQHGHQEHLLPHCIAPPGSPSPTHAPQPSSPPSPTIFTMCVAPNHRLVLHHCSEAAHQGHQEHWEDAHPPTPSLPHPMPPPPKSSPRVTLYCPIYSPLQ
jgi:hypothetical protein